MAECDNSGLDEEITEIVHFDETVRNDSPVPMVVMARTDGKRRWSMVKSPHLRITHYAVKLRRHFV